MDTVLNKPLTKEDIDKFIKKVNHIQYKQPYWIKIKTEDGDKYLLANNYFSPYPITEIRRFLND